MKDIRNSEHNLNHDKTSQLLQELRTRVRCLADEVEQLRSQNAAMRKRLEELEKRVGHEGSLLMLDADPENLKQQIDSYIQVIDQYLGQGNGS